MSESELEKWAKEYSREVAEGYNTEFAAEDFNAGFLKAIEVAEAYRNNLSLGVQTRAQTHELMGANLVLKRLKKTAGVE